MVNRMQRQDYLRTGSNRFKSTYNPWLKNVAEEGIGKSNESKGIKRGPASPQLTNLKEVAETESLTVTVSRGFKSGDDLGW